MTRTLAALLLAAAIGVACGGPGSVGTDPSPSAPAPAVQITMAADRQTETVHVGDTIQVALGDRFNWQLEAPDGVILARPAIQNYMLVRGTQAIWVARSVGQTTIRATGTAVCASGQPCPLFAVLFTTTVIVAP